MKVLNYFFLTIAIFLVFPEMVLAQKSEILSFKEWQQEQIQSAQISMDAAKTDLGMIKNQSAPIANPTPTKTMNKSYSERGIGINPRKPTGIAAIEARLAQAQLNLEVAKGLDIHDYFILYVCDNPDSDDFTTSISKLEPSEMALILKSYRQYILDHKALEGMKNSSLAISGVSAK